MAALHTIVLAFIVLFKLLGRPFDLHTDNRLYEYMRECKVIKLV